MSQEFKLRYDQLREGNPTSTAADNIPVARTGPESRPYQSNDQVQRLSILWPSGQRKFFKYTFLLSGDFDPDKDSNEILLEFSNCQILIKGYALEPLFLSLEEEQCRLITVIESRYASSHSPESVVFDVLILKQE